MIRRLNEFGMRSLDGRWAGGRPKITTNDEAFIVETADQRPEALGATPKQAGGKLLALGRSRTDRTVT